MIFHQHGIPVRWEWVIAFVTNDSRHIIGLSKKMSPKIHWNISKSSIFIFWLIFGGCQWQFEVDTEVFDVENPQRLQSSPCSVASPPRRLESAPPHPGGATGTSSFHWIIKTAPILTRTSLASNPILTSGHISKPPRPVVRFFFSRLKTGRNFPGDDRWFRDTATIFAGKNHGSSQVETGSCPFLL